MYLKVLRDVKTMADRENEKCLGPKSLEGFSRISYNVTLGGKNP